MNRVKLGLLGATVVLNPASLLFAGVGGAGVGLGLGALLVAAGSTAWKYDETFSRNSALHEFGDVNEDVKLFNIEINQFLEGVDASKLRSALQDADDVSSAVILDLDPSDFEYYFGEILEMSNQNLREVDQIIESLRKIK
eukprot:TRINITY_DN8427_c0_g1_i1.p2 TRINITY_DN8427_c0_g1~~TRINITY_DN8427_c0_g1_i1.p2  ORF type:complete len:140 (-),score=40.46 TRINITY_DN8427_c0_g1_i1:125-544(-)